MERRGKDAPWGMLERARRARAASPESALLHVVGRCRDVLGIDGSRRGVRKCTVGTRTCSPETTRDRIVRDGDDGLRWRMLWLWLRLGLIHDSY